jgi:hypothetical protein
MGHTFFNLLSILKTYLLIFSNHPHSNNEKYEDNFWLAF